MPFEVEDHRDRADVGRDLDGVAAAGLLGRAELALVVVQVGVGAGEEVGLADEVLDAGAGADLLVVDRGAAVRLW